MADELNALELSEREEGMKMEQSQLKQEKEWRHIYNKNREMLWVGRNNSFL